MRSTRSFWSCSDFMYAASASTGSGLREAPPRSPPCVCWGWGLVRVLRAGAAVGVAVDAGAMEDEWEDAMLGAREWDPEAPE